MDTLQTQQTTAILSSAKEALEQNQTSVVKAKSFATELIKQIDLTTIKNTPDVQYLDEQCKAFLGKISKTITAMNDRRKPITQGLDQIKKVFTTLENEMKDSPEMKAIREFRNKFAQHLAVEEAKQKAEVERKAAIKQEEIDIRAAIKKEYADDLVNSLDLAFTELETIFKSITLVNAYAKKSELNNFSQIYKPCTPQCKFQHITQEVFIKIRDIVSVTSIDINESEFKKAIKEKQLYYADRVDSRISELVRISEADQAEKKRLKAEAKARDIKQAEAKKAELLAFGEKQKTVINAEKTEASLGNLFEQTYSEPTANVKKTLKIEVLNNAAYGQIFMFWYEREGKALTQDKFEKVTVARMRKFCEDIANKEGETIDSKLLKYVEVVTAK